MKINRAEALQILRQQIANDCHYWVKICCTFLRIKKIELLNNFSTLNFTFDKPLDYLKKKNI